MSRIEKVSLNLSCKLGEKLDKTEDEKLVLNYGLFILLHTTMAIVITIIVGIITNTFLEIMIISIVSAILKRYSGGVHASSPERCTIIGVVLSYLLSKMCIYLSDKIQFSILIVLSILIILISYIILYKKCPVPSKNKPFKNENTRKKLRRKAFSLMNIYSILIFILLYFNKIGYNVIISKMIVCILIGISLQIFVLTNVGKRFINYLDKILTVKEKKGNN